MQSRMPILAAALGIALLGAQTAFADDLKGVLSRLDTAAANFHTTTTNFEFDAVTTQPIYDKDVQKGIQFFKREGHSFQWGARIQEENGRPADRELTFAAGKVLYFDVPGNEERQIDASKYESYLLLGFGASGKELAEKWNIKYLGAELINGVKTDKLELIAKDPNVLEQIRKVTIWLDTDHAVSLKQVFDEGGGTIRTCIYSNIKNNEPLPKDAFTLKTNKQTKMVK